jgi:hypothetical protein
VKPALEVVIPHVPNITPVSHLRSTLLQSSLTALRERGHFAAWSDTVAPEFRATIVEALAPTWLPIEVGMAHYDACDRLKLAPHELAAIGEAVGLRMQATFLGTLSKAIHQAGVTPWTPMPHFGRLWGRLFMGGSNQIDKLGPKDLELDVRGLALVRFGYFRHAYASLVRAGLLLFGARSAYVNIVRWQASTLELVMHAAWA